VYLVALRYLVAQCDSTRRRRIGKYFTPLEGAMTVDIPPHVQWISNSGETITLPDGRIVEVWDLQHDGSEQILSAWAAHFRNHYCRDADLPALIEGTGYNNREYLLNIKFPDATEPPGPSVRAGDFAEILIADFVEFLLGYWCPRELRYDLKWSRNESTKGCDVIGFKFADAAPGHPDDELFIFESKAALTGAPRNRLQDAVNDSIKDRFREALSLNAIKQRFIERHENESASAIARFQNIVDRPFKRISGAAAVMDRLTFDPTLIAQTDTTAHHNPSNLRLIVVRGLSLMSLVHSLYERAANEA
jgi:hypothetical protein